MPFVTVENRRTDSLIVVGYLSATFDPADVAAACKEPCANSRSMWLSPHGFVFPGLKGSLESNLHPRMPDEHPPCAATDIDTESHGQEGRSTFACEFSSCKWQENALHADMEPVLSRDSWSWDQRHIDSGLYKKPPELFVTTAPQAGQTTSYLTDCKQYQIRGPEGAEMSRLGLVAKRCGFSSILEKQCRSPPWRSDGRACGPYSLSQPCHTGSDALPERRESIASGFVPRPDDQHSLTCSKNVIPRPNSEQMFEKLQGADFRNKPIIQDNLVFLGGLPFKSKLQNEGIGFVTGYFAINIDLFTGENNLQEQEDTPPSSRIRKTLSRTIFLCVQVHTYLAQTVFMLHESYAEPLAEGAGNTNNQPDVRMFHLIYASPTLVVSSVQNDITRFVRTGASRSMYLPQLQLRGPLKHPRASRPGLQQAAAVVTGIAFSGLRRHASRSPLAAAVTGSRCEAEARLSAPLLAGKGGQLSSPRRP
ncbi:hypothetical protein QYF61_024026 [Mycteria americana]|uniref:Uncharacterized protein n=1 Tax=Mycteria americana TaxID=33587 RepID=A0AAN7RSC6_MYCAM|nr:hypothetical protein QYF61_024026 [Mycteria americana]